MACIPDNAPKSVILSTQTQCPECRFGIQSMLRKVQGVYSVVVNADRNTITVSGNLAPKELLNTLLKVSQDCDFCINPPAHVPPSACPANRQPACTSCPPLHAPTFPCQGQYHRPPNYGIRICSGAPMPACCACRGTAPAGYRPCSGYHGHAPQYPCHGRF